MLSQTRRFAVLEPPCSPSLSPEEEFRLIFADYPSELVGAVARKEQKRQSSDWIYGEINDLHTLQSVIRAIQQRHNGLLGLRSESFYDLGSGSGRPCIAAALCHPFRACKGIEINPDLFEISQLVAQKWHGFHKKSEIEIDFILGSFLDHKYCEWTEGDLVFVNSTCFTPQTVACLAEIASVMKKGAFIVTLSHPLPVSSGFAVLEELRFPMSW